MFQVMDAHDGTPQDCVDAMVAATARILGEIEQLYTATFPVRAKALTHETEQLLPEAQRAAQLAAELTEEGHDAFAGLAEIASQVDDLAMRARELHGAYQQRIG